jgi:hypothetical protein
MIHKGNYYEKSNHPGWLRLFLGLDRFGNGVYADFTGMGMCSLEHLARWSRASYSEAQARKKFPDECARIDKVTAGFYSPRSGTGERCGTCHPCHKGPDGKRLTYRQPHQQAVDH